MSPHPGAMITTPKEGSDEPHRSESEQRGQPAVTGWTTVSWVLDSVEVPTKVLTDPKLDIDAKIAYCALASIAKDQGRSMRTTGKPFADATEQQIADRCDRIDWAVKAVVGRL